MIDSYQKNQKQKTIKKELAFEGIGLHTGKQSKVKIKPAKSNSGITFYRTDIQRNNKIEALWFNVSTTVLSTTISNKHNVSLSTIEHLMSALSGMHIDNVDIYVDGPEVPIMDGSSKTFVELLEKSDLELQEAYRKIIKVNKEISVSKDDSSVTISPNKEFSIDF